MRLPFTSIQLGPFTPTQLELGAGALAVLVLLVLLTVLLRRRAKAKARPRARTEATLGAPTPGAASPELPDPGSTASPYAPGGRSNPPSTPRPYLAALRTSAQPPNPDEPNPTEPIPTSQSTATRLKEPAVGGPEHNGAGPLAEGHARWRPPDGSARSDGVDPPTEAIVPPPLAAPAEPTAGPEPDVGQSDDQALDNEPATALAAVDSDHVDNQHAVENGHLPGENGQAPGADLEPAAAIPAPEARATEAEPEHSPDAKDRLLRVLLTDPDRALHAVDDLETCRVQLDRLHESVDHQRRLLADAARRLRGAGLTPAQVARLAGFGEGEMATLLAEHAPSPVPRSAAPSPVPRLAQNNGG